MGPFKKKADPISARGKELSAQIAALEAQIKKLDSKLQQAPPPPKVRAPAIPGGHHNGAHFNPSPLPREPIFETVERRLEPTQEDEHTPDHYNDLGVRKYDLTAAWRRWRNHFRAPPASNPKLVSYLAAGSIKGLRPLRYEKRIARNRFIALLVILVCLVWGIVAAFFRH
jgi:hypothetical protein